MWKFILGIVILSAVVALAKEEKKTEAEKRTTEKRGATSFTHIVRGGTGHSSIAAGHGLHGLQIAYLPLAAYAAPGYAEYPKDIPFAVHQPYQVAVDKPLSYPIKIAYAVPVDSRPYPLHIIKPYPFTAEKPVTYPIDNPAPYSLSVPISQPVPYAIQKPYPVYVKAPQHGYDSSYANTPEYSAPAEGTYRGGQYSSYSDAGSNSYRNGGSDGAYKNGYSGDGH